MKITLEKYHGTCDDGCCGTCDDGCCDCDQGCCDIYGYYVLVDGKKIGSIQGDDVRWLAELLSRFLTEKNNL